MAPGFCAQSHVSIEGCVSCKSEIGAGCRYVGAESSLGRVESQASAAGCVQGIVDRDRAALKCQRAVEGNGCDDRDRRGATVFAPDRDRTKIPRPTAALPCRPTYT